MNLINSTLIIVTSLVLPNLIIASNLSNGTETRSLNQITGPNGATPVGHNSPERDREHGWQGVAHFPGGGKTTEVVVDWRQCPDLADWGRRAGRLLCEWYPRISTELPSDGFQAASRIRLVFAEGDGVAHALGAEITVFAPYVRSATNDWGMLIHELTHVVQAYPHVDVGWLAEGIADYVRLELFEPHVPRPRIDPDRASYRDAYKTTAQFLAWIEKKSNKKIVPQLNAVLRQGDFNNNTFANLTGKSVDEWWLGFASGLRQQSLSSKPEPKS